MEPTPTEQPTPPLPSLPVRIGQVFASPATLFDTLRERPVWETAIIGVIVLTVVGQVAFYTFVPEDVRRAAVEAQMSRFISDPAVLEQQVDNQTNPNLIWGGIQAAVFMPLFACLLAGVLLVAFTVIMGGEGRFKQLFSASVHALYVYTVGQLIMLLLIAAGAEQSVLSPGLLLPEMEGFFGRLLNGINVFAVWMCVVLGVAVSRIYPGRTVKAGALYMVALYLVVASAFTMLGLIFGA